MGGKVEEREGMEEKEEERVMIERGKEGRRKE